jgi:hypothetical protein
MELLNYARRCKKKTGHERHETLHAADNNTTFCGKELNEMWFLESNAGLESEDVTCKECRRLMRSNVQIEGRSQSVPSYAEWGDTATKKGG